MEAQTKRGEIQDENPVEKYPHPIPTLHSDKAQQGQTEGLFGLPTIMGTVYAGWL